MGLEGLREALGDRALAGEPMSRHTTFGIGGPADLFVVAHTVDELRRFVLLAHQHDVPFLILGEGTNLLVADQGIRGLVIRNACQAVEASAEDDGIWLVRADSGAELGAVAHFAIAQGLAGLEWAVDVPGTVGGAVVGNAGAYSGYVSDNLRGAVVLSPEGEERWWPCSELRLGYRTSTFKESRRDSAFPPAILSATFALRKDETGRLQERADEYRARRVASQPRGMSAGSVFKRTEQYPAGFLIENAGLKGTRIGGAIMSPIHANFIVNLGTATARDVLELIELIQEAVRREFDILLELEIELVGDW